MKSNSMKSILGLCRLQALGSGSMGSGRCRELRHLWGHEVKFFRVALFGSTWSGAHLLPRVCGGVETRWQHQLPWWSGSYGCKSRKDLEMFRVWRCGQFEYFLFSMSKVILNGHAFVRKHKWTHTVIFSCYMSTFYTQTDWGLAEESSGSGQDRRFWIGSVRAVQDHLKLRSFTW